MYMYAAIVEESRTKLRGERSLLPYVIAADVKGKVTDVTARYSQKIHLAERQHMRLTPPASFWWDEMLANSGADEDNISYLPWNDKELISHNISSSSSSSSGCDTYSLKRQKKQGLLYIYCICIAIN